MIEAHELAFTYISFRLIFVWERDAEGKEPAWQFVDMRHARSFLTQLADNDLMQLLRTVLASSAHDDGYHLPDAIVIEGLAEHLFRQRLRVVDISAPLAAPGTLPGIDPVDPVDPPDVKIATFIAIRLIDQHGNPIPGERVRVTLPNGQVRLQRLDQNGFARIDGIRPGGICDIEFPDIDGPEWAPV